MRGTLELRVERALTAHFVDRPAEQFGRWRGGRRLQRRCGLVAPPLHCRQALPGRRGRGRQRGTLADQALHSASHAHGRHAIASCLGGQKNPKIFQRIGRHCAVSRDLAAHRGHVVHFFEHHRPPCGERVDGLLHCKRRGIMGQGRKRLGKTCCVRGFPLHVACRIATCRNRLLSHGFGVRGELRCIGDQRQCRIRRIKLGQPRRDATDTLQSAVLDGQRPYRRLDGRQCRIGLRMRGVRLLPRAWCDRPFVDGTLRHAPGVHGLRQTPPAASVADQRFRLVIQRIECGAQVEQASARQQTFTGIAAAAQQFLGAGTQPRTAQTEAAFEQFAAGASQKANQRVLRDDGIGCIAQSVAATFAANEFSPGSVAGQEREADAEMRRAVQKIEIGAVAEPEQRIGDGRERRRFAGLVGAVHDVQRGVLRELERHVREMAVAQ